MLDKEKEMLRKKSFLRELERKVYEIGLGFIVLAGIIASSWFFLWLLDKLF